MWQVFVSKGIIHIKSTNEQKNETGGLVQVVNLSGQVLYSEHVNRFNESEIPFNTQENGIYFVRLISDELVVSKKIMTIN